MVKAKGKGKKKKVLTRINFILDETGSMGSRVNETISGFNEYLSTLRKDAKDILFSLIKFDSTHIDIVHKDAKLEDVQDLTRETYRPGALTPLYDVIGKTVNELRDVKGKVLVVVLTDGEENASHEYDRDKIFSLIKEKEKDGWTFIYLGANQDAWGNAGNLGFSKGNVQNFTMDNVRGVMNSVAVSNTAYACDTTLTGNTSDYFVKYGGVESKTKDEKLVSK